MYSSTAFKEKKQALINQPEMLFLLEELIFLSTQQYFQLETGNI